LLFNGLISERLWKPSAGRRKQMAAQSKNGSAHFEKTKHKSKFNELNTSPNAMAEKFTTIM